MIEQNVDEEYPQQSNSYLYNAMIHPLVRTSIYGALWYQGNMKINHKIDHKYNFPYEMLIQENQTLDGIETSMGVHLFR